MAPEHSRVPEEIREKDLAAKSLSQDKDQLNKQIIAESLFQRVVNCTDLIKLFVKSHFAMNKIHHFDLRENFSF